LSIDILVEKNLAKLIEIDINLYVVKQFDFNINKVLFFVIVLNQFVQVRFILY